MATVRRTRTCLFCTLFLVATFRSSQAQRPQLVQRLHTRYSINPAVTPEFNECRFIGNPTPTVEWSLGGESLPTTEQEAQNGVYYFPNNGSLILRRATSESSGNYVCSGTNIFGTTTVTTELTISLSAGTPWYVMWYMWFIYALILWALIIPAFIALFFYRKKQATKELPPPDPWIGN